MKRSPGKINDPAYHPMEQCGVNPYLAGSRFNSMEMAAKACRGDDKCKSFYFATYADNATTSTAECAGRGRTSVEMAVCGHNPTSGCPTWTEVYARTACLGTELAVRRVVGRGMWTEVCCARTVCLETKPAVMRAVARGRACSNPAHSDEASCEGDGGFWMAEPDDMGTCTDVNLQKGSLRGTGCVHDGSDEIQSVCGPVRHVRRARVPEEVP